MSNFNFGNDFNFNGGMFGDTRQKGSIRDMFDENGEPIVYDIYGNPVREEATATVEQVDNVKDKDIVEDSVNKKSFEEIVQEYSTVIQFVDDEPRKHERGNNERMLPSGNKELEPITVLIWAYLQSNSKCNHMDEFRYVAKKDATTKKIKEEIASLKKIKGSKEYINKTIDDKTIRKHIKIIEDIGLIVEEVDGSEVIGGYKGKYYRLKNLDAFKYYVLLENEFTRALIGTLNDFTLSLYLVYYGFNASDNCNGLCYLNQDVILERMGFSASGQNLDKLRFANALLRSNGLIRQAYEITKDSNGREVKRKLITVVPKYWETKLYDEVKRGIHKFDKGDKAIKEYLELK